MAASICALAVRLEAGDSTQTNRGRRLSFTPSFKLNTNQHGAMADTERPALGMARKMKNGTLTHSSGGRRLIAKKRNNGFWLHVEDGFSVVDMPIPDKLAEELAEFLNDNKAATQPVTRRCQRCASQMHPTNTGHVCSPCAVILAYGTAMVEQEAKTQTCEHNCDEKGFVVGLFAGGRVRCPNKCQKP